MMSDDPKLFGVLSTEIDQAWMQVSPILEKAIPYTDGKYSLEDINEGIKSRELQLWLSTRQEGPTTCMVTRIIQYPQEKILLIMLYAGESLKNMIHFKPIIYNWAKENGCMSIYIYGRAGWEKVLKDEGYEKVYSVLRMKL